MNKMFKNISKYFHTWQLSLRRIRYYRKQSLTALIINTILIELFLSAALYLWLVYKTKIPLLSFILTLVVMAFFTLAYVFRQLKIYNTKKAGVRRAVGRSFLAAQLRQLNAEEFKWQITRLLLQLDGITDIKECSDYLETVLQGKRTAIGLYNARYEDEVPPKQLADFLNHAKAEGYKQAVFVASGTYPESCRAMAGKKSITKVQLMDLDDLLDLMDQAGMFPDENTIDALIDKEIIGQNKLMTLKKEMLAPKRIRTYLGYSLFFFVLSRLLKGMSLYYMLASALFFIMALLSWFLSIKETPEPDQGSILLNLSNAKETQGS